MNSKTVDKTLSIKLLFPLKGQENLLICLFILSAGIIIGEYIGILFIFVLILYSLWKPELTLVLIFLSGFFKNINIIRDLPIDLTVLAVSLLLVFSCIKIITGGKLTKLNYPDLLIILQGLLVLFSTAFISSGTWLNWWDAGRFIFFNVFIYLGLFLLSVTYNEIINIIYWILYGVMIISSTAFHNFIFGKISTWHISSFGESYISLGLFIGLGILFFLHNFLFLKNTLSQKIINFALLGLLVFLIPFIPSRGVLIATIFTLLFFLIKVPWRKSFRIISIISLLLIVAYIGMHFANTQGINVKRFWSYKGAYARTIDFRINALKDSIKYFKEKPIFGIGMGEFMYIHGGRGFYPHNLLVESLVSFGIFGLFIFWPSFIISFKNSLIILKNKNMEKVEMVALWFIFFFFVSNVSGSLSDFRTLWLLMGILSILHSQIKLRQNDQT